MIHKNLLSCLPGHMHHFDHPLPGNYTSRDRAYHGLHLAAQFGHNDVIDVLLEHGAPISHTDALADAFKFGRTATVKHMLQCGTHITPELLDSMHAFLKSTNYAGLRPFGDTQRVLGLYLAAKMTEEKWPVKIQDMKYFRRLVWDVEDSAV
ncbi:hypothetical protein CC86DRAFT_382381 [Ophiobolus disseminans]|uniref:Uncharacterized protein n=1 Tax=Ophiobolus disseminans TaxID=1469910 RepID=A0A6A6ZZ99_9PLEO|nr:hypothetical protein CC86DRAFT_382381 [Ophiobolus disseminans]